MFIVAQATCYFLRHMVEIISAVAVGKVAMTLEKVTARNTGVQ